ncbi:MAG: DUF2905 family protein [Spirochaetes bacterium]|nr:DUF2905 family protein [Spirochaetota bacterium]
MQDLGKFFFLLAIVLFIAGFIFYFGGNTLKKIWDFIPLNFKWAGKNSKIYFPLGASILLSILLTIIINLFFRFFK